jgi:hypothetical protein
MNFKTRDGRTVVVNEEVGERLMTLDPEKREEMLATLPDDASHMQVLISVEDAGMLEAITRMFEQVHPPDAEDAHVWYVFDDDGLWDLTPAGQGELDRLIKN